MREGEGKRGYVAYVTFIAALFFIVPASGYGQLLGTEDISTQELRFPSIHIAAMASAITGVMSGDAQFPINRRTYLPESSIGLVAWSGEPELSFYLKAGGKFGVFQYKGNYNYKDRVSYLWGYTGLGAMIGPTSKFRFSFDVTRCYSVKEWYHVYARTGSGRKWFYAKPLHLLRPQFWVFQPGIRFSVENWWVSIYEQYGQRSIVNGSNRSEARKIHLRGFGLNVWIPLYQIKL